MTTDQAIQTFSEEDFSQPCDQPWKSNWLIGQ